MQTVPFINFGYVEGYKANHAYNLKNFIHSIRNAGLKQRFNYGYHYAQAREQGIYSGMRILVCYEGLYYDIAQEVAAIAPDGYLEGNADRQRELKNFLMTNFPNFPVD